MNKPKDLGARHANPRPARISEATAQAMRDTIIRGTPPRNDGRFRKGESGNPNGRPKIVRPEQAAQDLPGLNEIFLAHASRMYPIQEGGKDKQASADDLVIKSAFKAAINGSPQAQRTWLQRSDRARRYKQAEIKKSNEFWRSYIRLSRELIEEAQANGKPEPEILPHPDDVLVREGEEVQFTGPFDQHELAQAQHTIRLRDAMLLQSELDDRNQGHLPVEERSASYIIFLSLNDHTPKRFRLSNPEIQHRSVRYRRLPKRELLKLSYREFRALGLPFKRGQSIIKTKHFCRLIELIKKIAKAHKTNEIDFDRLNDPDYNEEFNAWAERIVEELNKCE